MAETMVGLMYYFNHGVPLDWVSACRFRAHQAGEDDAERAL